jgi:hypothetical protein
MRRIPIGLGGTKIAAFALSPEARNMAAVCPLSAGRTSEFTPRCRPTAFMSGVTSAVLAFLCPATPLVFT